MKKRGLFLCFLFPFFLYASQPPDQIQFLSGQLSEIQQRAAAEGKLYLVYFTAEWCMPCQWMEKNTFTDNQLSTYVNHYYLPYKVDIDDVEGFNYKQQFEIVLLPSFLIFSAQGELLDRFEESLSASKMLLILQSYNTPQNRSGTRQSVNNQYNQNRPQDNYTNPTAVENSYTTEAQYGREEAAESSFEFDEFDETKQDYVVYNNRPSEPVNPEPIAYTPAEQNYRPKPERYDYQEEAITTSRPDRSSADNPPKRGYTIQIGAFSNYAGVQGEAAKYRERYNQEVYIFPTQSRGKTIYKLALGAFNSKLEANAMLRQLKQYKVDGFVKNLADF